MPDEPIQTINGVEVTRPAKHGLSLEFSPAEGQRAVVRVFAFEEGLVAGSKTELPRAVSDEQVLGLLGEVLIRLGGIQGVNREVFSQEGAGDLEGGKNMEKTRAGVPTVPSNEGREGA